MITGLNNALKCNRHTLTNIILAVTLSCTKKPFNLAPLLIVDPSQHFEEYQLSHGALGLAACEKQPTLYYTSWAQLDA